MSDSNSGSLKLGRLLAEGVVVVASILIAFALDAWWDDRQLEKEMAEDLAIVDHELTENLALADKTVDIIERVTNASNTIVTLLREQADQPHVEVEGTDLFWGLWASPTLDPSFGAIDAWIAAGRLAGIESLELRQRLAGIRGKVSDVTEEQIAAREMLIREIHPLVRAEMGDIAAIKALYTQGYGARFGATIQDLPDIGNVSVPNSSALRFQLDTREIFLRASREEMRDFRDELEAIQQLLHEEMNK